MLALFTTRLQVRTSLYYLKTASVYSRIKQKNRYSSQVIHTLRRHPVAPPTEHRNTRKLSMRLRIWVGSKSRSGYQFWTILKIWSIVPIPIFVQDTNMTRYNDRYTGPWRTSHFVQRRQGPAQSPYLFAVPNVTAISPSSTCIPISYCSIRQHNYQCIIQDGDWFRICWWGMFMGRSYKRGTAEGGSTDMESGHAPQEIMKNSLKWSKIEREINK